MKFLFTSFVFCFLVISCKQNTTKQGAVSSLPGNASPFHPSDIDQLSNTADYVDMLFYNLPVSVSQNDRPSIIQTSKFLTTEGIPNTWNVPSIGRLSFSANGKIIKELDIHWKDEAKYLTLVENKTPKGSCKISKEGIYFLNQLFTANMTVKKNQ